MLTYSVGKTGKWVILLKLLGTHQFQQQPRPFALYSRGTFDDNEFSTFQLMMN
jgi:hypothetical protein